MLPSKLYFLRGRVGRVMAVKEPSCQMGPGFVIYYSLPLETTEAGTAAEVTENGKAHFWQSVLPAIHIGGY